MTSSWPFRYFGDGWNFFIAVSSNDVYLSHVYQRKWDKYELWTGLLSNEIKDTKYRNEVLSDFSTALLIVFHDNYFYILTSDSFIIYSGYSYFTRLYKVNLKTKLTCADDLQNVIQDYMNSCKGKWNKYGDNNDNKNIRY